MNYLNIFLVESGAKTRVGKSSGMGFKLDAKDLGLEEPGTRTLRVEKPALLNGTVPVLLFGLLSLVEPAKFNVVDFRAKQQRRFL